MEKIKLTESTLNAMVKEAIGSIIKEYTKFDKEKMYGKSYDMEDYDDLDFNESPVNNLVGENRNQVKLTESQLKEVIRESVNRILNEIGDTNRGQYMLGALAAKKRMMGNEKGLTDRESGFNDISDYAKNKQDNADSPSMKRNAYYNGWHSSKGNRNYGYNQMKNIDKGVN